MYTENNKPAENQLKKFVRKQVEAATLCLSLIPKLSDDSISVLHNAVKALTYLHTTAYEVANVPFYAEDLQPALNKATAEAEPFIANIVESFIPKDSMSLSLFSAVNLLSNSRENCENEIFQTALLRSELETYLLRLEVQRRKSLFNWDSSPSRSGLIFSNTDKTHH